MEQLPKIVRERLNVAKPAVDHPDADVLTAFSERSLPEIEQAIVVEHLARCGECREILALSLPPTEEVQIVAQSSPQSWFGWPSLRWGFAAAGIVLIASLGILQHRKSATSSMVASRQATPTLAQPEAEKKKAAPPAAEFVPQTHAESPAYDALKPTDAESVAKTPGHSGAAPAASPAPNMTAPLPVNPGLLQHGPRMANQFQYHGNVQQQNALAKQASSPPPVPLSSPTPQGSADAIAKARVSASVQTVDVTGETPPPNAQAGSAQALVLQNQPMDQQPLNGGQSESKTDRDSSFVTGFNAGAKVPGRSAGGPGSGVGGLLYASNARWSINSAGGLQRSTDQGKTWQDVNVTNNSAPASAGLTLAVNASPKELDKKAAAKNEVERSKSMSIVFRAVSANGSDVWAGGSAGMLYHSTDAGAHWTRIIPLSPTGAPLTGEILTVAFADAQHGKVSTSTAELWSTADAGQTWQKH